MDLDQNLHSEPPCFGDDSPRGLVVEQRQHRQHRIGTVQPSLHHLTRIEEEILRQDGAGESGPRRCQIGQRASETRRVDEHAERIGNAIVTACDRSDIGAAANHSSGRRGFLDFEDEPRAGPGERILETERGPRRI